VDTANEFAKAQWQYVEGSSQLSEAGGMAWPNFRKFVCEAAGQVWFQITQLELVLAYPGSASVLAIVTMVVSILSSVTSMSMASYDVLSIPKLSIKP